MGWTASRFYWHGDGDLMVVMNPIMMVTMAKVWWEGGVDCQVLSDLGKKPDGFIQQTRKSRNTLHKIGIEKTN